VSPFFIVGGEVGEVTVSEAGRKGGITVLRERGREHFIVIGKKGQQVMRKRYPGMASEWGKKGGRPRKNNI
jgi:general stress protein YciG